MKKILIFVAIVAINFSANAQETPAPKTPNPFSFLQNIFSPKPAALTKLIDEKKLFEADDYLRTERQYFWVDNKKNQIELLKRLGSAFNSTWETDFDTSITSLSKITEFSQDRWAEHRKSIEVADSLCREYVRLQIFSESDFHSPKLAQLSAALKVATSSLDSLAPSAFEGFNHAGQDNFFSIYPKQLPDSFLSDNSTSLQEFVRKLSATQIVELKKKYPEKIVNDSKFGEFLSNRYFEVSLPTLSAPIEY